MSAKSLLLVTAPDCHLCAHGRDVLVRLGAETPLAVREVDAGSEEAQALAARGVPLAFLPVVWDGARVLGYGRLSERRLRRELAA